jgi:hypothetical protein
LHAQVEDSRGGLKLSRFCSVWLNSLAPKPPFPSSPTRPAPFGSGGSLLIAIARNLGRFAGLGNGDGCLWPRWIVLRAVGLVYVVIFAGIIREGRALIGPDGIEPIADLLGRMRQAFPGSIHPFVIAPSLFWIGSGEGMILLMEWLGLAAAVALALNLWPRMSLFVCWVVFLSFVSAWGLFSPAQLDDLMLEAALLCIPFAPPGLRPGLGADSPPRPIVVLAVRWLAIRVMLESGLVKLIAADPRWHDLTAMDVMHELAPLPTFLGYLDHQLPHAWHLSEAAFTFVAELAAPLLAVFGGRRGRWFAFGVWTVFQLGIELTTNFGWLNLAAIALGVLLLDDGMLRQAAGWLGFRPPARPNGAAGDRGPAPGGPTPSRGGRVLRAVLGAHFGLTLCYFLVCARIASGMSLERVPAAVLKPVNLLWNFHCANAYYLYPRIGSVHYEVEFAGSDDAGRTWRPYAFRYLPQDSDRICPFLGAWFPRFEVTIQNFDWSRNKAWLFQTVAAELMAGNPDVTALFARNPFPTRPPTRIRIRYFRVSFTDYRTYLRSGRFWRKEYKGDYLPMMVVDRRGQVVACDLTPADTAQREGNYSEVLEICARQYALGSPEAGFRLAQLYARGIGLGGTPERAFAIYNELARCGEVEAGTQIGNCYENGIGVPQDDGKAAAWYRASADRGSIAALYALAGLHAKDLILPRDDVEGLALLREASQRALGEDPADWTVRQDEAGYERTLRSRMTPDEISRAEAIASRRILNEAPTGPD